MFSGCRLAGITDFCDYSLGDNCNSNDFVKCEILMWSRFTFNDVRIIVHYLGILMIGYSAIMLPSVLCAIAFQEWGALNRYIIAIGASVATGALFSLAYVRPEKLTQQQAVAVTALSWLFLSFAASFPLFNSGHYIQYTDALFDAFSAFTTTGATLMVDLDHLSNADNMFRFMMHFTGGLGIIVVALSLGIFGKGTSAALFTGEGRSEHVIPNIVSATRFILKVAIFVIAFTTLVLFMIMCAHSMSPTRAILHAFWMAITSFVTGGFSPMSDSIMYYNSLSIEIICMIAMLLGSVSFTLIYWVFRGKSSVFFEDLEVKTGLFWLVIMTAIFTASALQSTYFTSLPALIHRGVFTVISAFTTTGLSVLNQTQLTTVLSSGAFLTLALVMAVGGSAGSTAGGIKFDRLGVIAKSIILTVKQAVSPTTAKVTEHYYHSGRRVLDAVTVKNAMTIFILFVVTYTLGTLAGITHGYDASKSMFEAVAITSNAGVTCGIASSGMPISLEIVYIILMWAGRLEFIALLSLIAQFFASLRPKKRILKREPIGPGLLDYVSPDE